MAIVSYGTITITDTNDIESIVIEYARNQSSSSAPESGWSTNRPAWAQGYYIWQRTRTHKAGTDASKDTYGTAVCITGSTGATGATGQSLSSTKTQYTNVASNITITTSNHTSYTWTDNVPAYNSSKPAYWARITNTYTNPAKTEYLVYKDQGITDAIKTSNDANTTAGQAKTTAEAASQTANQTQTNLTNYINSNDANITALQSRLKRIWINENTSGDYVAGTYAASGIDGTTFSESNPQTYGYNTLLRHNMLALRYNTINMTALTTNALTFYVPTQQNGNWVQGKKGLEITSSGLSLYNPSNDSISMMDLTSSGLIFKTSAGTEIGKFGSDSLGGLLELSGRLNIKGGGRIGQDSDNYWEFGDNKSYNDEDSAYLIGKGTASIQLGEAGHWRIDSNRIHTGWYQLSDSSSSTPAGSLHFDTGTDDGSTYYWDYGMHYPDKAGGGNNKFLYIRRSNDTTSTTLKTMKGRIDDDTWWTYKFWVDGSGNVHAPGFYIGDSTTPIGGGAGTVAERLTQGYGSATQPVYFDNNGTPTITTYQLNAAGAKGVVTDIANNMSSTNLPTTAAVVSYVTSRGYVTTDKNVQTSQANTTKIYLAGTPTTGTATGTLNYDSNVYLTTTAGTLHATTFDGTTFTGTAAKATNDSDGNKISTTYLKLSGGTVSGEVEFGSAVSVNDEFYADSITAGNLIVNGAGRFTNGLYGDLTGNVTGSITGNASTADKVNHNLVIKLASGTTEGTNMFTFNGSIAKTVDITKSALGLGNVENKSSATIRGELTSANVTTALGFTPYNATNPNGYTTNTGTVTSVAAAAASNSGITISGSPITTSGTITIGLNLSTAINGLGEGTSTANRNDYIVAQYSGGGTTTTTYHRRKLSNIFAALNSSDITTALGFTPYNATNPNGYTSNTGTVTSVRVQATSPIVSSTSTASSTTLDTTISLANGYGDTKNPYGTKTANYVLAGPSSGNAAAPTFRALVAADIPTITKSKISDFPASLKNPNALKVRVYSGTSTPTDTSYDGSTANQSVEVAGKGAITGVSAAPKSASSDVTTFTLTKADGSTSTFDIAIVASEATGATTLRDSSGPINKGSTTKPVYFSSGVPVEANTYAGGTAVTLNGSSKASSTASFYAPTGAGTSGQVLTSSGGTPGWTNQSSLSVGSATTATKFSSNRTVALTGDVTGSVSGDGSSGWSVATTVQDDSHNHTLDTILPLKSKTFTDVIASANNWANGVFFFGSIKPTTWNTTWRIRYKINVYVPNHPNYCQMATVTVSGRQGTLTSFASFNTIGEYYVCYYHELYRLKADGFTNGYGHSLGVRFQSAYVPTDTDYKRTIEIDLLETKNCSFDFYDSCLKYAEIPGTGTTNYNTYSEMDFVSNGLQETGDSNDVNYYNRSYYGSRTTKNALYRYQFCVTDSTGQVIPINSVNNSVATNKTLMTDSFDPFGEIFQWVSTSTYAAGANVGNGNWYRQYLADLRYSFNCGGYDVDSTLTARLPLYLVVVPQGDGTVKLHSEPLSQTLPTSDDGLLYIYLGRVYEDAKPYRVVLTFNHPVYWYKDGAVRQYTHMAARALADESGNTISSTYVKKAGDIMTGNLGIKMGDTDKHIIFDYDGDGSAGASWRIAALGTGSNDTNYFAIQSGTSTTTATAWNNVIRLGQNTYDAAFGGNVYPLANNSKTLGTSSLKWSNVYATTFTGNLSGNVTGTASGNVLYGGVDTGLGSGTPAATAKEYYSDTSKVPSNSIKMYLNSNGTEYTTLFANRSTYGSILKWGYADKYMRILRYYAGNWKSDDWEKMDAGYADTAGTATSATSAASAAKWTSAQTVYVTLGTASKTTTLQGGSSSAQTIGVDGTLGVGNGGTGATSFTSGALLIGNGSNAIGTRSIVNNTSIGALGWTGSATTASNLYIPTLNTLAYWNGAYRDTSSNLTYCIKGAFGTATIKDSTTSVASGGTALPTAGAVYTAIRAASDTYVTLTTAQTLTAAATKTYLGLQLYGSQGIGFGTTGTNDAVTQKANVKYDDSLQAIVFSFS